MSRALSISSWLALSALVGCAGGRATCRLGAECASGVCLSDGTCARAVDAGPGDGGSAVPDDAAAPLDATDVSDASSPGDGGGAGFDGGARVCAPNRDGIVSRDEVPLRPGLRATFRVAQGATVSTAGTPQGSGRAWDFTGPYSGDSDALVELLEPGASWWSSSFPTATHAARLSASSDNLGVFRISDDALLLLGVVSPTAGVTQTRLSYEPPVMLLAFPLRSGDTFSTTSTVSGQALGVPAAYTEEYTSVVDASGTMATPFGMIEALRVRTEMVRRSGLVTLTTQRQFAFVGECFGIAALVVSNALESQAEFTAAAELRRLAP